MADRGDQLAVVTGLAAAALRSAKIIPRQSSMGRRHPARFGRKRARVLDLSLIIVVGFDEPPRLRVPEIMSHKSGVMLVFLPSSMTNVGQFESRLQAAALLPKPRRRTGFEIFSPAILKTTVLTSLRATGAQGGYYAITTWLPTFLKTERQL